MLAMNYRGPLRVRIDHKPMPEILHPQDAIVRVTRSCICGSDLHLYNGSVPDTRPGMTFGHEFTGVVEEIGPDVQKLKVGDHVLVPFNIACGKCVFCQQELYGNCHESNPQATAVGGIFGYSHTAGGFDGGQAEYARVPYADVKSYSDSVRYGPGRCRTADRRSANGLPGGGNGRYSAGGYGRRIRSRSGGNHGGPMRVAVRRGARDRD